MERPLTAATPPSSPPLNYVHLLDSDILAGTMEKTQYTITHQPLSQAYMSPTCPPPVDQRASGCCSKNKCHAHRLKVLVPALLMLLTLASLALWFWCSESMSDLVVDVGSTLWKRQNGGSAQNQDSPFVRNKRK
ncbi:hypothetical protein RHS02_04202, partial [Rhizoctonia solani]